MTAEFVAQMLKVGLLAWLAGLMLIVVGRVLRGDISSRGVLADHRDRAGSETTPARAIAMLVFPLVILFLVVQALNFDPSVIPPGATRPSFPDISDNLLLLLTGGNGLYLAGKMSALRNGVGR
jgi:hypothetical protein